MLPGPRRIKLTESNAFHASHFIAPAALQSSIGGEPQYAFQDISESAATETLIRCVIQHALRVATVNDLVDQKRNLAVRHNYLTV
jgi:hypothetical protein